MYTTDDDDIRMVRYSTSPSATGVVSGIGGLSYEINTPVILLSSVSTVEEGG